MRKYFKIQYKFSLNSKASTVTLATSIPSYHTYYEKNQFTFLNFSKKFDNKINWNASEYGKLWTYNLTYFEFLNQESITPEEGLLLIEEFIKNIHDIQDGLEPFPISLRVINWIKFLNYHKIKNQNIEDSLYAQSLMLADNLEYHLQGNHLLENAFALLFASYYFEDAQLYNKANHLLKRELKEQILSDGGHFELSPMYHQLMLFRLLDAINLLQHNHRNWQNRELITLLKEKASFMLGWLKQISYHNGEIPLLNDSAKQIAPHSNALFAYAKRLNIRTKEIALKASGYRKFKEENYELLIDVGEIGASYLAGHAHADTFNFELRINHQEFIVDTGISTYQINKQRDHERGTSAHNTVCVNQQNSSQVWDGFRVANRANIIALEESGNKIVATHNGYKHLNLLHTRTFERTDKEIIIKDTLSQETESQFYLHFHPNITEKEIRERISSSIEISKLKMYQYPLAYNSFSLAYYIVIDFDKELITKINIENN